MDFWKLLSVILLWGLKVTLTSTIEKKIHLIEDLEKVLEMI
jgi:hypothetical protein